MVNNPLDQEAGEREWRELYESTSRPLRKRFMKRARRIAQLHMLAEVVRKHPRYPVELSAAPPEAGSTSLSIPSFLEVLNRAEDIAPYLVIHRNTLLRSAQQLNDATWVDRVLQIGGTGGALYAVYQILCKVFLEPVLGIPCDGFGGPMGQGSLGSLAWLAGGLALLFLQRSLVVWRLRQENA
jgi:hypothetical protein